MGKGYIGEIKKRGKKREEKKNRNTAWNRARMHTLGIIHAPGEESLNPGGITSRSVHPYHCAIEQSILWWLNLGTQLSDDMVDFGGKFFRAKGRFFSANGVPAPSDVVRHHMQAAGRFPARCSTCRDFESCLYHQLTPAIKRAGTWRLPCINPLTRPNGKSDSLRSWTLQVIPSHATSRPSISTKPPPSQPYPTFGGTQPSLKPSPSTAIPFPSRPTSPQRSGMSKPTGQPDSLRGSQTHSACGRMRSASTRLTPPSGVTKFGSWPIFMPRPSW